MIEAQATARYVRTSAQKAGLVLDLIRGKDVNRALATLRFARKSVAEDISKVLRSAIANAQQKEGFSGDVDRLYVSACYATIGQVGNLDHENVSIGKAGRSRWLGQRPHVRGVAMNPVDHPLGGGEGKTSGGRHPVSPWGQPTKGYKTRNRKATDKFIVQRRQK